MVRDYPTQHWWRQVRQQVLNRDGRRCQQCGNPGSDGNGKHLTVDHVVPRRLGGSDHPSNLVTLCRACHGRRDGGRRYRPR